MPTITSMGFAYGTIDDFGSGVFRKVRRALGVTAFGVNAMVLPPGTGWFEHFHDEQDELYFVHRGRAAFDVVGGKGGYVGRDGLMVDAADEERRRAFSSGEEAIIRRLPE